MYTWTATNTQSLYLHDARYVWNLFTFPPHSLRLMACLVLEISLSTWPDSELLPGLCTGI